MMRHPAPMIVICSCPSAIAFKHQHMLRRSRGLQRHVIAKGVALAGLQTRNETAAIAWISQMRDDFGA